MNLNKNDKKIAAIQAALSQSKVENLEITRELSQSFMDYSMSVITARSLADVRDGLKPIHRRILYTAFLEGLTSDKKLKKCAKLVGDVMGSFHPHGEGSIYGALVGLAQDFSMRYPLIFGQGNFGSIDGDGPAAMRYTESQLSKLGDRFLDHIKEDVVDFVPNYDGSKLEPAILPTPVPNILINGVQGIAVGVATNIPAHNLSEVCDAILAVLYNPNLTVDELSQIIRGPDFPTGGIVHDAGGILNYLATGRGSFQLRAKVEIIKDEDGERDVLLVKEIPYNITKTNLINRIIKLNKLPTKQQMEKGMKFVREIADRIDDIRDESSREGIRLLIFLKKGANPHVVLNALYRHSELQVNYSANLTALVNSRPEVLGVIPIIKHYIQHQLNVLLRRLHFNLEKVSELIHILEGRVKIGDDILQAVRIINESDEPEVELARHFQLSEKQVADILNLRIRAIKKIELNILRQELVTKQEEKKTIEGLLASESAQIDTIAETVRGLKTKFGDARRTQIIYDSDGKIDYEALVKAEDVVITLSERNYLKRTSLAAFKTHNRGSSGVVGAKTFADDAIKLMVTCNSKDSLIFATSKGVFYRTKAFEITEGDRNSRGKVANLIFPKMGAVEQEQIVAILVEKDRKDYVLFATVKGGVKKVLTHLYDRIHVGGKIALRLVDPEDRVQFVTYINDDEEMLLASSQGKLARICAYKIRPSSRISGTVRGLKLKTGEALISTGTSGEGEYVFSISAHGIGKLTPISAFRLTGRNTSGVGAQKITAKTGPLLFCLVVNLTDEVLLLTNTAKINRFSLQSFNAQGRNTSGVRLFKLKDDERLVYAAKYVGGLDQTAADNEGDGVSIDKETDSEVSLN